jgi:predicted DNA-binding protein
MANTRKTKEGTEIATVACRLPKSTVEELQEVSRATGLTQSKLIDHGIRMLLNDPEMMQVFEKLAGEKEE